MIDTIRGYLKTNDSGKILELLSNVTYGEYKNTGNRSVIGKYHNLNFHLSSSSDGELTKIRVTGSLNKYFHGNNFTRLLRTDLKKAILKLSSETGVDFTNLILTRVDVGLNLFVNRPVEFYQKTFNELSRFKKRTIDNCPVMFTTQPMTLSFYNKVEENRVHGKRYNEVIPKEFKDLSILRYELKLTGKPHAKLGMKKLLLSDLYQVNIYKKLINLWKEKYKEIRKSRFIHLGETVDVRSFVNHLALLGISHFGGEEGLMGHIDNLRKEKNSSSGEIFRLKTKIREISTNKIYTSKMTDIVELDNKIRKAVEFYL
jgi:hypothetical protein